MTSPEVSACDDRRRKPFSARSVAPVIREGTRLRILDQTLLPDGEAVEIEERGPDEVREAGGATLTLAGTPCRNPAFDVTPAQLVTALVTERGVAAPPDRASVAALLH